MLFSFGKILSLIHKMLSDDEAARKINTAKIHELENLIRILPDYIECRECQNKYRDLERHPTFSLNRMSMRQLEFINANLIPTIIAKKLNEANKHKVMSLKDAKRLLYKNTQPDMNDVISMMQGHTINEDAKLPTLKRQATSEPGNFHEESPLEAAMAKMDLNAAAKPPAQSKGKATKGTKGAAPTRFSQRIRDQQQTKKQKHGGRKKKSYSKYQIRSSKLLSK